MTDLHKSQNKTNKHNRNKQLIMASIVATTVTFQPVTMPTISAFAEEVTVTETTHASKNLPSPKQTVSTQQNKTKNVVQAAQNYTTKKVTAKSVDNITHVTPENFSSYFTLSKDVKYDNGLITLTEDRGNQSGNFALNEKIDLTKSFTLKGEVNLGNKAMPKGADGIGFAFHAGEPNEVGAIGGALGIGNLKDAFGFKLDTYLNTEDHNGYMYREEYFFKDPEEFALNQQYDGDGKGLSYGAFTYTTEEIVPENSLNPSWNPSTIGQKRYYAHTYMSPNTDASAKEIDSPDNNTFKKITFEYNADNQIITINYNGKTWTENINVLAKNKSTDGYCFIVSASTGGSMNLQQFRIEEFNYTAYGKITADFVEKNNPTKQLADSLNFEGPQQTPTADFPTASTDVFEKLYADGYDYVEATLNNSPSTLLDIQASQNGYHVLNQMTFLNQNQKVTYFFQKANGNLNVRYADQDTQAVLDTASFQQPVGDSFPKTAQTFLGYSLVKTIGSPTGSFTRQNQEITYYYQKDPPPISYGDLTVTYVDENNTELTASRSFHQPIGNAFPKTKETFTGYSLVKTVGDPLGTFASQGQTIAYHYKKDAPPISYGDLTVTYVDENNTELTASRSFYQPIGDAFPKTKEAFTGYSLIKTVGDPSGTFASQGQTITYHYKKDALLVVEPPVVEPPVVEPPVVEPPVVEPPVVEPPVVEPPVVEPPVVEPPVVKPPVVEPPVVEPPVVEPPVVEPPVVEPPVVEPPVVEPPVVEPPVVEPPVVEPPVVEPPVVEPPVVEPPVVEPPVVEPPVVEPPVVTPPVVEPPVVEPPVVEPPVVEPPVVEPPVVEIPVVELPIVTPPEEIVEPEEIIEAFPDEDIKPIVPIKNRIIPDNKKETIDPIPGTVKTTVLFSTEKAVITPKEAQKPTKSLPQTGDISLLTTTLGVALLMFSILILRKRTSKKRL